MPLPDDPWWRDFIDALPARTAKLAQVTATNGPRVAPVWVALDGDDVVFTTGSDTAKAKALRRDPRVAMCFDDERPPFSYVIVYGTASISEDLDELRKWATIIGGRYMGDENADAYGARNGVPGELLVRISVTKVLTARDVAE